VDSSGFVHICSQNESLGGLQYTTNASGTWVSTIIDGTTHGDIGSHASIAVDSADRVHISYKGDAGLEYATNASGAWLTRVVHVDPLRSTGSSTSIAVDSSDKVHISYLSTVGMDTMYLSYTTNAFGSWQKVTLDSGPYSWPEVLNNYTSIAVDGSDKAHISYRWGGLKYATNASGSWTKETLDPEYAWGPSIAVDGSNRVHISYSQSLNKTVKYATNASGSWMTETVASTDYGTTSIALDIAGKAHISYEGETGGLRHATNASGAWVTEPVDASPIGEYCSIALDGSGALHIGFHDYENRSLKYATNASGPWAAMALDSVGNLGGRASLALDGSEKAHLSYADDGSEALKYATNAPGGWVTETVDPVTAEDTAIALDSSGKVHIGYLRAYGTHRDDADLKVATNASGSWQTVTVDSCPGTLNRSVSIDLDSADKIHISYTSNGLKYGTNASGGWVTETVDASGGADNSMALDSSGKVHIGYRASAGLKVATNGSGAWVTTELDSTAWDHCSVSLDDSDKVHITYVSYIDGHPCLRYATNASGVWVTQTVHTSILGLEFFEDASIAVDSLGTIHICHREPVTSNLRYTTNASGSWVLSNLCNRVQGSGVDTSIAVGQSGTVYVGHHGGDGTLLLTSGSGSVEPAWRPAATVGTPDSGSGSAGMNYLLFLTVPAGIILLRKVRRR